MEREEVRTGTKRILNLKYSNLHNVNVEQCVMYIGIYGVTCSLPS